MKMMPDFTAIIQLRLKQAFSNIDVFRRVNNISDYLNVLFETTRRAGFFVLDDTKVGLCVLVFNTKGIGTDKLLQVKNRNHFDVFLWHIDGVLFSGIPKCDCAILTKNQLVFVEFKSNALNNSCNQATDEYQEASDQLDVTLNRVLNACASIGTNIKQIVTIRAQAVFNKTVPRYNATQKNIQSRFLKKNKVKLEFSNQLVV